MKDETMAWLSYADENLDVARLTLEHGHLNASLQNAQQAVEKYLKAVIIEKDLEFRRTHSIRELTGLLSGAGITADISDDEIDLMDTIYVPSKYPVYLRNDKMAGALFPKIWAIGNLDTLENTLIGLFCSVKCPGDLILSTYDLARALRDKGIPVIGGFHTPIETD